MIDPCNPCTESTTHPCVDTTYTLAPMPLCFSVSPCNEGCADVIPTDCIVMSKDTQIFLKGQNLTSVIETIENYITTLAIDYNQIHAIQLIRYVLKPSMPSFTIVVKRNQIEVLNGSYTDINVLLVDLLLLDTSWTLDNDTLYVRGTNTWEFTLTY